MAVAIQQTADAHWLLTQYPAAGWTVDRVVVLKPAPLNADGSLSSHVTLEAFEWTDVALVGLGNLGNAVSQLQAKIQSAGSDLYAYAVLEEPRFDALGVKVTSYRLLLLHSQVQLAAWAVVILAGAFAAVIFLQYLTTGQSPAVKDLQNLWGSGVTALGQAAGQVGGGIASAYIWATVASGAILIVIARVAKGAGVKSPPTSRGPSGSVSVKAGPATVKAGTS